MEAIPFFSQRLFSLDEIEKISDEQGFIGIETFKPNAKEEGNTFNLMEEEDYSTDTPASPESEESQIENLVKQEAAPTKENYSKDCLKFCRKISNLVSEQISFSSEFVQETFRFTSKIMESFMGPLNLQALKPQELENIQSECLLKLWSKFKDVMSYSKNKKICIVKQEYWQLIFDKKTMTQNLREICQELSSSWQSAEGRALLQDPTFLEVFCKMLFACNQMLTITLIVRDSSSKGVYLRDLVTIENFITLMLSSELFQFYNHRSGKFARECCGKCKVCRSKTIPETFSMSLYNARQKSQVIVSFINDVFAKNISNNFEIVVSLMEFAFSFI